MQTKRSKTSGSRPTVGQVQSLQRSLASKERQLSRAWETNARLKADSINEETARVEHAEQFKLHQEKTQRADAVRIFTSMQTLINQLIIQSVDGKVSLEMVGWASSLLQQTDSTHRLWTHVNAPSSTTPSTDAQRQETDSS